MDVYLDSSSTPMITSNTKQQVQSHIVETRWGGCNWGGTGLVYFWNMCCSGPTAEHVPVEGQTMMSVHRFCPPPPPPPPRRVFPSTTSLSFVSVLKSLDYTEENCRVPPKANGELQPPQRARRGAGWFGEGAEASGTGSVLKPPP